MGTSNIVIICVAILLCNVAALSSPSLLKNYHFGATATANKVTNSHLSQQIKPYVPDGLTEEQYRKIKNDELAKTQEMDFGAWGPRFKRVKGDESGNWFNLPSLWTGGFDSNDRLLDDRAKTATGIANLFIRYCRRYAIAYLTLLVSTQLLAKSLFAKKELVLSSKWVAARVLLPLAALKPIRMMAALAERRQIGWLKENGTKKMSVVTAALMTALAFLLRLC